MMNHIMRLHTDLPVLGTQLASLSCGGGTTPTNNYHHYVNVDVANEQPSSKWSIWQQFQWPVGPPEQNRWSKCGNSACTFVC